MALSATQIKAVEMLSSGVSISRIATDLRVPKTMIRSWLREPEFACEVEQGFHIQRRSAAMILGSVAEIAAERVAHEVAHGDVKHAWRLLENLKIHELYSEGHAQGMASSVPNLRIFRFDEALDLRAKLARDTTYSLVAFDRALVEAHGYPAFIEIAWNECDSTRFERAPHIEAIAKHLEMGVRDRHEGKSSDLSIALPPGASKSMLVSVLLQPWTWTWWPEAAYITAAYDDGLAHRLSTKSRNLVESQWYQDRWPCKLTKTLESFWLNESGGKRIAVGIGSRITGEHAHILILDDPVKEQLTRIGTPTQISAAVRKAVDYWFGTLPTRVINFKAFSVLVHQRLHVDDPIGVAKREHNYRTITLPARFDPTRMDVLDHRIEAGEILCERLSEEAISDMEIRLGPRAARAQLQQDPVPLGGALLVDEYLSHRYSLLPSDIRWSIENEESGAEQTWITSWDLTFKGKPTSDYVVGQVWCQYHGHDYLVDQVRKQAGFKATKQMMKDLAARYPWVMKHIVEDGANAAAIEDDLIDEIAGLEVVPHGGGCLARTQQVEGIWSSGQVVIPESAPWVGGSDGFVAEHLSFDGLGTMHDDQVSASSLALLYLHRSHATMWSEAMKAAADEMLK